MNHQQLSEQEQIRREKLAALRQQGIDPYRGEFKPDSSAQWILDRVVKLEGARRAVAGRIISIRGHGKANCTVLKM